METKDEIILIRERRDLGFMIDVMPLICHCFHPEDRAKEAEILRELMEEGDGGGVKILMGLWMRIQNYWIN